MYTSDVPHELNDDDAHLGHQLAPGRAVRHILRFGIHVEPPPRIPSLRLPPSCRDFTTSFRRPAIMTVRFGNNRLAFYSKYFTTVRRSLY